MRSVSVISLLAVTVLAGGLVGGCKSSAAPAAQAPPPLQVTAGVTPTASITPTATGPTVTVAGKTGCALVSQAEASAAAGTSLPAGKADPYTLTATVVAHSGCGFTSGTKSVAFDINTIATTIPVETYESLAWGALEAKGAKKITVDGHAGITITISGLTDVSFYNGQTSVIVSCVHVNPSAAMTVAELIAQRM
jgi:hypothetical protein